MPKKNLIPKTTTTWSSQTIERVPARRSRAGSPKKSATLPVVVSMGCPSGVGPEVALLACLEKEAPPTVIVGDRGALLAAGVALGRRGAGAKAILDFDPEEGAFEGVRLLSVGKPLAAKDRAPGKPSLKGGEAQLLYIEAAYALAHKFGWPLATAPVSKEAIARSGLARARSFRGHTEWLEALDGARHSVMCFACEKLTTSLVTTHIPLSRVSRALDAAGVARSILELADLLLRAGKKRPLVAVSSLNPHAGESQLLGGEELKAIVPGIVLARKVVKGRATIVGPIGAETAYRKGASGSYDGVVAMYHDQATIPMKLLDFGGAVNVTQGLSIVRTSVDHGTAYDIAGKGVVDPRGMREAIRLAQKLARAPRQIAHGTW
jgi:4-hydroxythreonine-4-phosphate dehydrogenase